MDRALTDAQARPESSLTAGKRRRPPASKNNPPDNCIAPEQKCIFPKSGIFVTRVSFGYDARGHIGRVRVTMTTSLSSETGRGAKTFNQKICIPAVEKSCGGWRGGATAWPDECRLADKKGIKERMRKNEFLCF
ncbi:hypothetical protein TcasGA2_TC010183 [Tribolium castaneum]|uniref:Uncharacterized protein n=1 Tax=Tribolium castaneum TaxID=7070 RepID=D6WTI3_TRICA|nr:hypothetical protein TcasGA2_TC010183 [Tribolium castaneum]